MTVSALEQADVLGVVRTLYTHAGCAFIRRVPGGGRNDLYANIKEAFRGWCPRVGERVRFDVVAGPRGPRATSVRRVLPDDSELPRSPMKTENR